MTAASPHPRCRTTPDGLRIDGPTFEDFVAGGGRAEDYPPQGFVAIPTIGYGRYLAERYRAPLALVAKAAASAKAPKAAAAATTPKKRKWL